MPAGVQAGQAYVELVPQLDPSFASKAASQLEAATTPMLQRVSDRFSKIGDGLRNFGAKASTFVTLPLVAAGAALFNFASDADESLNKARVVFGDSAASIESFADHAATNLGISRQAALETTGTFGNLFTAMGLGQPKAAALSQEIAILGSDLASFNNADPTEVLEALRAGLVGEVEPLRRFGINLNQARIEQRALELGLWDGTSAIDAGAKAQAAYSLILDDTKAAQGDFARTSDGAANQQRILTARFKDAAAELGARLLPIGNKVLEWVSKLLDGFQELSPAMQDGLLIFAGLAAVAGPVAYVLGAIATVLGFILSPVGLVVLGIAALVAGFVLAYQRIEPFREVVDRVAQVFTDELLPAVVAVFEAFQSGGIGAALDTIVQRLQGLSGAGRVVVAVLAAIAAAVIGPVALIAGVFILLYTQSETFRQALSDVADFITGTVVPAVEEGFSQLADTFGGFVAGVEERLDGLVEAFTNIMDFVVGVVEVGLAIVSFLWAAVGDDVIRYVEAAWNYVVGIIQGVLNIILGLLDVFIGLFTGDWDRLWQGLSGIVAAVWGLILNTLTFAWESIKALVGAALSIVGSLIAAGFGFILGVAGSIWGAITGLIGGAWDWIVTKASQGVEAVIGFVSALPGRILGYAGAVLGAAVAIGAAVLDGIINGIGKVASFAGDVASGVAEAIGRVLHRLIARLNDAIPNSIGFIDLPDNPIPNPFHTGGIVPGRPGQEVPALLMAGEGVFTRDQMSALGNLISRGPARPAARASTDERPVQVNINLYDRPSPRTVRAVRAETERGVRDALVAE